VTGPESFVTRYEAALATQSWAEVEPLVHEGASVTFSDGSVHRGRDAVRAAFERNFAAIEGEAYRIAQVRWVLRARNAAGYLFDFEWRGRVGGRPAAGAGRGTTVLVHDEAGWRLLVESLIALPPAD
jgi:ketosteroid isomerase-like protein